MPRFKSYVSIGDNEFDVVVHYRYYPGYKGARDFLGGIRGAGPPLEPDEPAFCEIQSVIHVASGYDWSETVDEDTWSRLQTEAEEDHDLSRWEEDERNGRVW